MLSSLPYTLREAKILSVVFLTLTMTTLSGMAKNDFIMYSCSTRL